RVDRNVVGMDPGPDTACVVDREVLEARPVELAPATGPPGPGTLPCLVVREEDRWRDRHGRRPRVIAGRSTGDDRVDLDVLPPRAAPPAPRSLVTAAVRRAAAGIDVSCRRVAVDRRVQ